MQHTHKPRLSELLADCLIKSSDSTAIEDSSGAWNLSYGKLDTRADVAADWLSKLNADSIVLCLDKSADLYSLLVACFKHERNFCPVDPINPTLRVASISRQLPNSIVICSSEERASELRQNGVSAFMFLGEVRELDETGNKEKTDEPVYYISTSGSTGTPKIVEVPYTGVVDFLSWSISHYEVDSSTRWAQFSSIGFDLSIVDLLTVLCAGGTLIPISTLMDKIRPATAISRARISHWHSVPSVISYILRDTDTVGSAVRRFTFCGEPLHVSDVKALIERYPESKITNTYGPTEGTLFCSYFDYDPAMDYAAGTLPIGAPIPGWEFLWQQEGDDFRLIVSSGNIAKGYVGFESSSFSRHVSVGGEIRTFDTGDYFKMEDGEYFFSHRNDGMVKVSGNRVDLGDVEAAAKSGGLQNPVCVHFSDELVVIAENNGTADTKRVLEVMRKMLPNYALPKKIHYIDSHPRNANGKIDRRALMKDLD